MSESKSKAPNCVNDDHDVVWSFLIPYVTDSRDRAAVSLVCKDWYEIDRVTRKHVTIALCYSATPQLLSRRFPQLESLTLKGKPRAAMFNLIPEDWGGYVRPWVHEIASSFANMKALHFRRMIVTDSDLELLAASVTAKVLEVLKLDNCSGFSTDGLLRIAGACRCLRNFSLEESMISGDGGEWLHELASNNTYLEYLNFYKTDLTIESSDLELIARKCLKLVSVKISDCDIYELIGFFRAAASLEEFVGGSLEPSQDLGEGVFNEQLEKYSSVVFPPRLCRLGISFLGKPEMPIVFPVASRLTKLDLMHAFLDTEGHCSLLQRCPNLECLEARNVIGDRGLEVLGKYCKKMKRLRVERGADEVELEDEEGFVSHRGLIALAEGCPELEYLAVYVSDITNASLECIGTYSKKLCDFRLVLLDKEERITDLPLDNGVRSLLMGCLQLRRFALYLRSGGLTDLGLSYVGKHSPNVRWMLLGSVGDSDAGLLEFSKGCPRLQKLEIRGCCFSEGALSIAAHNLSSLRYLWVQGYRASADGRDLLAMVRPYWNIELIPAMQYTNGHEGEHVALSLPAHILAYYSLAGQRNDFPATVMPLLPPS